MPRLLTLLTLALALAACGGGATVTVHNGTPQTLDVSGLPGGSVSLEPGAKHHARGIEASLDLTAASPTASTPAHSDTIPLPPPGGRALWSIGGTGCFVDADVTQYYEMPPGLPASVSVVAIIPVGQTVYSSNAKILAGPGQRLPKSHGGGSARVIVEVPCDATASENIARSWVEMILPEIEPK